MNKEDLFDDDFLKQFKSGEELSNFLKQLQKRGLEKMLEGELDGHLDYEKNQRSQNGNTRNGYSQKRVRGSFGEANMKVPRDREGSLTKLSFPREQIWSMALKM